MRPTPVIAAVVVGLLSFGCTPEPSDRAGSTDPATAPASEPATSDSPSPVRTPSRTPTPTPTPVRAADGTDLKACSDGTCEVLVKAGDVIRPAWSYKIDTITVASLKTDQVRFTMTSTVGGMRVQGMNVSASGKCVNGKCQDTGALTITTKVTGKINRLRVALIDVDRDRAVVAFTG